MFPLNHKENQEKICIFAPIYPAYDWLLPILIECVDYFWPDHPQMRFAGLENSDVVLNDSGNVNWAALVRAGLQRIKVEGFTLAYLITEEHIPVRPCHVSHLNETLPRLMRQLSAVYISLMGWDNRRYSSRSPILGKEFFRLKHLSGFRDPRFHLHPALWQIHVLERCCEIALEDQSKNGSAWHFEKSNDKATANLPNKWKQQCYQLCAAEMRREPLTRTETFLRHLERISYLKLMALYPLIPSRKLADSYFRLIGFDRVVCDGPYPMVFSGVFTKGKINPILEKGLSTTQFGREIYTRLLEETLSRARRIPSGSS
ncbi:MAG: hypothetical protein C5B47_06395 [Verrucomicrobia bacterium]|nr:MAG: hypothetical protein C5B47_06395 [Verrucomicrobiota bacterium]